LPRHVVCIDFVVDWISVLHLVVGDSLKTVVMDLVIRLLDNFFICFFPVIIIPYVMVVVLVIIIVTSKMRAIIVVVLVILSILWNITELVAAQSIESIAVESRVAMKTSRTSLKAVLIIPRRWISI
jgi:hypothetical protein